MIVVQNKKLAGKTLIVSTDISDTGQITLDAQGKIELENEKAQLLSESEGFELQIVEQAQPKVFDAILRVHGSNPPSLHVIRNTTGYNFVTDRDDAGIYRIISDTPCFTRSLISGTWYDDYSVLLQSQNSADFHGYTLGYVHGNATIMYIDLLSPGENGYIEPLWEAYISLQITFKDEAV